MALLSPSSSSLPRGQQQQQQAPTPRLRLTPLQASSSLPPPLRAGSTHRTTIPTPLSSLPRPAAAAGREAAEKAGGSTDHHGTQAAATAAAAAAGPTWQAVALALLTTLAPSCGESPPHHALRPVGQGAHIPYFTDVMYYGATSDPPFRDLALSSRLF